MQTTKTILPNMNQTTLYLVCRSSDFLVSLCFIGHYQSTMNDFIYGFKQALSGFELIKKPKVKRFVLIPLCINLVLFSIGLAYAWSELSDYLSTTPSWLPESLDLPNWLSWIDSAYQWLIDWFGWLKWVLVALFLGAYSMVVFYTFTIFANLISSPFNGAFAAAVERHLVCDGNKESIKSVKLNHVERPISQEVRVAIMSELRKYAYMLKWLIPILFVMLVLFFIPLANALIPVIWFLFGAWMMSIEYSDYPLGNYGLTFKEEKEIMREHRMLAMGFGSAIMLMTMIPVVNFFAVPVGVAGATRLVHNRLKEKLPHLPNTSH